MTEIPQTAIDAAADMLADVFRIPGAEEAATAARIVLAAAAPHIATAERERIRQLALTEQAKYPLGTIASHALETFATQLTEGTTT